MSGYIKPRTSMYNQTFRQQKKTRRKLFTCLHRLTCKKRVCWRFKGAVELSRWSRPNICEENLCLGVPRGIQQEDLDFGFCFELLIWIYPNESIYECLTWNVQISPRSQNFLIFRCFPFGKMGRTGAHLVVLLLWHVFACENNELWNSSHLKYEKREHKINGFEFFCFCCFYWPRSARVFFRSTSSLPGVRGMKEWERIISRHSQYLSFRVYKLVEASFPLFSRLRLE